MLSSRVDLTAHMDFSEDAINIFKILDVEIPVEIPDDEYAPMSVDEYIWLIWWEGIFGRRGHRNQKYEIFNSKGILNEIRSHCYRCGKPFRTPWDDIGGVCRKCNDEICDSGHTLPWKKHNVSPIEGNIIYNLFNSR